MIDTHWGPAHIIENCTRGPKLLELSDGIMVKLFYRSSKIVDNRGTRARRFIRHARELRKKGIRSPIIIDTGKASNHHWVRYHKLAGLDCRSLPLPLSQAFLKQLVEYLVILHQLGVFFRAIHLGNILYSPQEHFSLIDVADCKTQRRPLALWRRARNLAHLFSHRDDRATWTAATIEEAMQHYAHDARLSPAARKQLEFYTRFYLKRYASLE